MAEQHEMDKTRRQEVETHHDSEGTLSRRQFMQGVMVASAAAAGVAGAPTLAAKASAAPGAKVLTLEQVRVLGAVLNRIIPAEGVMPAAGDLGIAGFIDEALGAAPHLSDHFVRLLTTLPSGDAFTRLSEAGLDSLLHQTEQQQSESFDILIQATYTGYYSHRRVLAGLGWVSDHESEPFDTTLLDEVRKRGLMYKDA